MKTRIMSLVCAIALIFTLFPQIEAKALEHTQTGPLYIYSKDCPEEYMEYALNTVGDFLGSSEYNDITDPWIGTPFTFANPESNIYYFPIYDNGKIAYTFRVYKTYTGDITGILSEALVNDLNEFSAQTNAENPLKIYCKDDDSIIFSKEDSPSSLSFENSANQSEADLDGSFVVIECKMEDKIEKTVRPRGGDSYINLFPNINYIDVQPQDTYWCVGYVSAAILNYTKINATITPKEFMKLYGITDPKKGTYLRNLYYYLIADYVKGTGKFSSSALSFLDMAIEIEEGRPVAISMRNIKNTSTEEGVGNHAVVVRGLDSYRAHFSIWNPWYRFYESIVTLDSYTPAISSTREYSYSRDGRTVYGIKNLA